MFFQMLHLIAAFNLTWGSQAADLSSHPLIDDIDGPAAIATDPAGNATVAWSRTAKRGATEEIWAASYDYNLRIWTGSVKISGDGPASHVRIAMDHAGNALILWNEGFPSQILYRTVSTKGVWSPDLAQPPSLLAPSIHTQSQPQVGFDKDGNALAIWMECVDGIDEIHSAAKAIDSPWVDLGAISTSPSLFTTGKSLAVNEDGDAFAVWETGGKIHGARYAGYHWSAPFEIRANMQYPASTPCVGIDGTGNGLFVWCENDLIRSRSWVDGGLASDALIASDPAYKAAHPDIGVDTAGNGVVVFERYNSLHKFVASALLPFQAKQWSHATDISAPSPAASTLAGYPLLALNAIGDGVAIWFEENKAQISVQGAGYALGTWSPSKILAFFHDKTGLSVPAYAISINLTGNIMAVWPAPPSPAEPSQIFALPGIGLANLAPPPPLVDPSTLGVDIFGIASGKQTIHRFPAHSDIINTITWHIPNVSVSHYNIYRNSFSILVGTSTSPYFEDHQRTWKQDETYLITCVDQNGQESSPLTLVVRSKI